MADFRRWWADPQEMVVGKEPYQDSIQIGDFRVIGLDQHLDLFEKLVSTSVFTEYAGNDKFKIVVSQLDVQLEFSFSPVAKGVLKMELIRSIPIERRGWIPIITK